MIEFTERALTARPAALLNTAETESISQQRSPWARPTARADPGRRLGGHAHRRRTHFAGALIAQDLGDGGPDGQRRFDFLLTYDREVVVAAARRLMSHVDPEEY